MTSPAIRGNLNEKEWHKMVMCLDYKLLSLDEASFTQSLAQRMRTEVNGLSCGRFAGMTSTIISIRLNEEHVYFKTKKPYGTP